MGHPECRAVEDKVGGQEIGIARAIHALLVEVHPRTFEEDGDARHAALGDVGRRDRPAAVVPHLDRIAGLEAELEAAAPEDLYRDSVLTPLRSALESGKQVIANRVSHFVRLESLNETKITIDDPAEAGKNSSMTWEEARAQGFFRRYVILEK